MNYAMEFHDSYLKAWGIDAEGNGFALFNACLHRAEGPIFGGLGHESGWQDLRLDFEGMRIEGEVDFAEDTYLSHGDLWVGSKRHDNILFLPAEHSGELRLEMCVAPHFDIVKILATNMASELLGEFEHEHFWQEDRPIPVPFE
jgi:hypothetical protein